MPILYRRRFLLSSAIALLQEPDPSRPDLSRTDPESDRLPNGKSQKIAIARENHERALRDAEQLLKLATELQNELKRAGEFVVPLASVRRTEEIEKLARNIRGRLRA